MRNNVQVAVVGAGPYGLSLAAHLNSRDVQFRIFGNPMHTWMSQMPKGMCLKSEGFASWLYDPKSQFTLRHYCEEQNIPYQETGLPVKLETFIGYGQEFQRRMVPQLENRQVTLVEQRGEGFRLQLEDGEELLADRVVIAAGISHFQYLPPALRGLPPKLVSHSSDNVTLDHYAGKDVTVVGGGASALDLAALLRGAGATVRVIARRAEIKFHNPPRPRSLWEKINAPMTGLGPGWRSLMCVNAPLLFHQMPLPFRKVVVQKHLGPAPAWFTREVVVGHVDLITSSKVEQVEQVGEKLRLLVSGPDQPRSIETDHVIAATGYKTNLERLRFLSPALRANISCKEQAPVLSMKFESSAKGLYFVGAAASLSFGPLLRFAYGAKFSADHLSRHLRSATGRQRLLQSTPIRREALHGERT